MEHEDIDRVVESFAAAARRCKQGGFDGIEILSHSHLLGQFLSPQTNFRTDDYGGDLENRMRITLRVLDSMRAAVGSDFLISIRVTGDELSKYGLTADDCVNAAKLLDQCGNVDLINVVAGAPYDDLGLAEWVRPMGLPSAKEFEMKFHSLFCTLVVSPILQRQITQFQAGILTLLE
jgi:2,4-dienoyl-CoA reductase-like NADH-dependent reductase (Old Yellow Enzyme family)